MSKIPNGASGQIPTLATKHSGVPVRLAQEAVEVKAALYASKTVAESTPRTKTALPPGVTQDAFDKAILELKHSLGSENVELNDKPLVDGWYIEHPNTHDPYHIVDQEELICSAMVYPSNTPDVQVIVRWANKHKIPIYPMSMGRNIGYGGAAVRVPGSVLVDLGRRMNKVLEIDADNASCMVEPGVSYYALYEEIQKRKLPLWIDCPDLGGGSVLGNACDRGVGFTPYGDHFANHCGMELVLPTGEVLRTGMGALPGKDGADNPTWQSFQTAYGPYVDGIFCQSNYGIVTKMGFWLMPETGHQSYILTFPRDSDFESIIEIIKPLAQKRLISMTQLRHAVQELAVLGKPRSHWYKGKGHIPRDVIREKVSKLPVGDVSWIFYGTQFGDQASIDTQLKMIKSEFGRIEGFKFYLPSDLPPDHYINYRAGVHSGVPLLKELDWLNWVPNAAHLFFSPITPAKGKDATIVHNIITKLHAKYGFDVFPTVCVNGREIHYIDNIVYDRGNLDEKRRAVQLMRELIRECAKQGYGEYRTHLLFQDQVAETYGWNDGALRKFNEAIKDTLDPNSILAPGRNGIWGKEFRGKGWELLDGDKRDLLRDGVSPKL
ncbi:glycolate oxidase [Leptodontidium sp. MPI-SDFR-AT-0119]|nr:glycolate oxidase [Leptodontidium sp. MPI-SDFR-AT-0119]